MTFRTSMPATPEQLKKLKVLQVYLKEMASEYPHIVSRSTIETSVIYTLNCVELRTIASWIDTGIRLDVISVVEATFIAFLRGMPLPIDDLEELTLDFEK